MSRDVVYLDHQASTPLDPRVLDAMLPFLSRQYANPSSEHRLGRQAAEALRTARRAVQASLRARYESEIVFTSGATEGNYLAILGAATGTSRIPGDHVVTTAIEHKSVLDACGQLAALGYSVTTVPVDSDGTVDPVKVAEAINPRTVLVSVMHANNEIGTVQPVAEIAEIVHGHGALLHVDAVQALGTIQIDVEHLGIDLLTLSAHKIYGPKGVGALYVRRGTPLRPLFSGSQEHGMRGGTANLSGAVGLAEALNILFTDRESDTLRMRRLRDNLADQLLTALPDAHVNGNVQSRLPANLSLTIPGVEATCLIDTLPDLAISAGSACTSGQAEPSHVLTAIGLSRAAARATIRISIGRHTTDDDVTYAADRIATASTLLKDPRAA